MRRSQYYPVAGAVLASILASCADTGESRPLDGADTQHADGSILDADVSGSHVDTTDDDPSGQDAANAETDTETGTEPDAAVGDTLTDTDTPESDTAEPDTTPDDADSDTQTDSGDIERTNEAPIIVVAAPEDGAVIAEGRPLVFRARFHDDLDTLDNLTIAVSSSLQGVLFDGPPRSDGSVLVTVAEPAAGSHTLRVVATDTDAASSEVTIAASVLSALPVPRVHISPEDPEDDDALIAALDLPADPEALGYTLAWDWRVDGEDAAQDGPAVDAEQTEPGQVWMVRATLTDSRNRSSAATATVTIQAPNPLVDAVVLAPDAPDRATTLRCDATLDESTSGAEFRWWAIASGRSDQRLSGTLAERAALDLLPGQRVVCDVVPFTGTLVGNPLRSNEIEIANRVPVPGTVSVEPSSPEPGDSLRCVSQGVSDADGDALSSAWTWTINGDVVEGANTAILSQPISEGDEVSCALTVADQWDSASTDAAPPVVAIAASETEPTVQVVALGPCQVLACDLTGYDAAAGNFTWTINGEFIEESSQTLGSRTPVDGDLMTCGFISPDTSGITSAPFVYRPLRPAVDDVKTTTSVRVGDTVDCTPIVPDGLCSGAWEYEFAWTVNGRVQAGETLDSFSTQGLSAGDQVRCIVIASDGDVRSAPTLSAPLPVDAVRWTIDGNQAGARFGWDVAVVGDMDGDELGEILAGAPAHDYLTGTTAGAAFLIYGRTDTESLSLGEALSDSEAWAWYGESGGYDLNTMACGTYTFPGGCPTITSPGEGDAWVEGPDGAALGYAVADAGDTDGDGVLDILLTAPYQITNGLWAGRAYILSGADATTAAVTDVTSRRANGWFVNGECGRRRSQDRALGAANAIDGANGDLLGSAAAGVGDMNGDGLADVLLSAPNHGGRDEGASYLVYGQTSLQSFGLGQIAEGGCTNGSAVSDGVLGASAGARFRGHYGILGSSIGIRMTGVGDVNGDGLDDALLNSGMVFGSIAAYLVFGGYADADISLASLDAGFEANPSAPADGISRIVPGNFTFGLFGITSGQFFAGFPVGGGGDVNGDGYDDIVFVMLSAAYQGSAYVLFGKESWTAQTSIGSLATSDGILITGGIAVSDDLGDAAIIQDINGDGYDDIAIGSPTQDGESGGVWVVLGRPSGAVVTRTQLLTGDGGFFLAPGDLSGHYGASVSGGDIDHDGLGDLLVGAPFAQADDRGGVSIEYGRNFTEDVDFVGGPGADHWAGSSEAENFVAGRGADSISTGGGADVVYAGAGDDTILIQDAEFRRIYGGPGEDTLRLTAECDDLDLVASRGRIADLETIEVQGQTLSMGVRDVLRLSRTSNRVRVQGESGSVATVAGDAWLSAGTVVDGGIEWITLSSGLAELWIDSRLQTRIPPSVPEQFFDVAENTAGASVFGRVGAVDPDGTSVTYAIIGGTGREWFSIDVNTGNLSVASIAALDYEQLQWPWTLDVAVMDADGLTTVSEVIVSLTDVPESPVFLTGTSFSAEEGQSANAVLASVGARDPDIGDTITFSLDPASSDLFEISLAGEISTQAGRSLDYELSESHEIVVTATDSTGRTASQIVTVKVLDREFLEPEATLRISARDRGVWSSGPASQFEGFEAVLVDVETNEVDFCAVLEQGDHTTTWPLASVISADLRGDIYGEFCVQANVAYSAGEWNGDGAYDLALVWPDGIRLGEPFVVTHTASLADAIQFWGESFSWSLDYNLDVNNFGFFLGACFGDDCRTLLDVENSFDTQEKFELAPTPWQGAVEQNSLASFSMGSGLIVGEPFEMSMDWDAYWILAFERLGLPANQGTFEIGWQASLGNDVNQQIDYLLYKTELGYLGEFNFDVSMQIHDVRLRFTLESGRIYETALNSPISMNLVGSDDVDGDRDVDVEVTLVVDSELRHEFFHRDTLGTIYTIGAVTSSLRFESGQTFGPQGYGPMYDGGCIPTAEATRSGDGATTGIEGCAVNQGTEVFEFETDNDWVSTTLNGSFQIRAGE